ncbi:XRE family transcriptional regulator [Pseudomonas aeruginosa]|uniref:LexA repressor n=4 Tax=Pseudomonas TaxID=286 RepID=A0A0N9ZPV9_PSEAI|nr:LexA repressor [Pseudomonas aeruginosa]MBG3975786.1 helix-turn-helix domain-containing protein [Pseudomonas aeruginosa]MBG5691556.1 helix-turn-helix domain-containing protein [Pseudomonas aeruginosa]MBI8112663.1 helix-turn-helix domain-containing protein [Pseudomonas aeruginosa]MBI8246332.1 helix-turn-helix domain-containing protein [Pseudomonas aeruginosa]
MPCVARNNTGCSISSMNDWIKAVRSAMAQQGITQDQLAERIGKTQGAVGHWLNGRREPGLADINQMLTVLGLPPLGIQMPQERLQNVEMALQPSRAPQTYPLISWVAAGQRAYSPDNFAPGSAEDWLPSTENAGPHGYWLIVKGPSMTSITGPSFPDGTPILIKPEGFDLVSGKFYIARHRDGESTFKQYIYDAGREYLVPLNPKFEQLEMDDAWDVIGRVIDSKAPRGVL